MERPKIHPEPASYTDLPPHLEQKVGAARLAFFDIDQTLVVKNSPDGPSQPVRDAVAALGREIPVGLVSARPKVKAEEILRQIPMNGFSIFSDGGQIWNHAEERYEIERVIDAEFMNQVVFKLHGMDIVYWVQDDGIDHVINGFDRLTHNSGSGKKPSSPEAYQPQKPFVIVAHAVSLDASNTIIDVVHQAGFENISARRGDMHDDNTYDVFISDAKTNKKDALAFVAEKVGISPNQILGFGDGLNDIALMQGSTGIAMDNAHPETKQSAAIVIPSVYEDGVAKGIGIFLPLIRAVRTQSSE